MMSERQAGLPTAAQRSHLVRHPCCMWVSPICVRCTPDTHMQANPLVYFDIQLGRDGDAVQLGRVTIELKEDVVPRTAKVGGSRAACGLASRHKSLPSAAEGSALGLSALVSCRGKSQGEEARVRPGLTADCCR